MEYDLQRFVRAQESDYQQALQEIRHGRKETHWIWYIFPQLKGLGYSYNAEYYGIESLDEARAYLEHPILGPRLLEITEAILNIAESDPRRVMGYPDDLKLQSSMTLFCEAAGPDSAFSKVLDKFYKGRRDEKTLDILDRQETGSGHS